MDFYEITVKGHLDAQRAASFAGLRLMPLPNGCTLMSGLLRDQADLHAMLSRIRDMGIVLISVKLVACQASLPTPHQPEDRDSDQGQSRPDHSSLRPPEEQQPR